MKDASRILLVSAELLFISSLALPALKIIVLGKPSIWEGWRATAATVGMLGYVGKDPALSPLITAGLGNVAFIVAPWLLWVGGASSGSLRTFACLVTGAFALALWAPHSELAGSPKLLVGYVVWLLAYALLLGSVALCMGKAAVFGKGNGTHA